MKRQDARKLARTQARCFCERCLATLGPVSRRWGKLWQARYGESTRAYRRRYVAWHNTKEVVS